jgi:hypothetical protein
LIVGTWSFGQLDIGQLDVCSTIFKGILVVYGNLALTPWKSSKHISLFQEFLRVKEKASWLNDYATINKNCKINFMAVESFVKPRKGKELA